MFDHLFENRNKTITNLIKLSDCLGRSLRENVELFAIDSEKSEVAFLTEGGKVITGTYTLDNNIVLDSIRIQEIEIFTDNNIFETYVDEKVSKFVGNLNSDNYRDADESFNDILSLWENRLKFDNVRKKLEEKVSVFSEAQHILSTPPFQRFLEVMPQFLTFLEEEKEDIINIKEIENAIKLSNSVSKAFNTPKMSIDDLEKSSYTISRGINESIYEMLCRQELVKKELLESKKSFEVIWATNTKIRNLASLLYEDSEVTVLEALVEAVVDVPYLALSTKKQLVGSLDSALGLADHEAIPTKDIKEFASRLFDMKKPLKKTIISLLNEKYGINIQNLQDTATFTSLATTQTVIFESLARLAPKGSIIKTTLSEMGKMLKGKNGVEVIDINDILQDAFDSCNYSDFCEDFTLVEGVSFDSILDEGFTAAQLVEKAKEKLLLDKNKKKADPDTVDKGEDLTPEQQKEKSDAEKHEAHPDNDTEEEDDSVAAAERNTPPVPKARKAVKEDSTPESEDEPASSEADEEPSKAPLSKDDFLDALKDLDELMAGISPDEEDEEAEEDETEA
jgi:hypothetical protein